MDVVTRFAPPHWLARHWLAHGLPPGNRSSWRNRSEVLTRLHALKHSQEH